MGDVAVNEVNDPANPTLVPGVEAQIDQNSEISGSLKADSIGNEPGTSTAETLCNDIQGQGPLACENPDPLLFPIVGLPAFQPTETDTSTAADVSVAQNQSTTLTSGTYRDISLAKNASVCFAGGVFDIRSIDGALNGNNLVFQAATEVRIDDDLILGSSPFIGADDGSFGCDDPPLGAISPTAAEIVFFIAGDNVATGAGKKNDPGNLNANFYLGSGDMVTGKDTDIKGGIIARDFTLNRNSTVVADVAFSFAEIPTGPTADPQDVFTDGDTDLEIILTGSDPQNENLSFTISVPPGAAGSITSGPMAIQDPALKFCSVTSSQLCSVDADCPGEFCADTFCSNISPRQGCMNDVECAGAETCTEQVIPPIASASVTYDPVDATDAVNSFTFKVTNESTQEAAAVVDINPVGDVQPDPPDIATVEAFDGAAQTTPGVPVTIRLRGDAPCDEFDETTESLGECLVGVDLTFNIGTACGDTDPGQTNDCASPSPGDLSGLTPESADVVRTATVVYDPDTATAGTTDSFEFEVCGEINGDDVCDVATVTVNTEAPTELAGDLSLSIAPDQEVEIALVGNSGGVDGSAMMPAATVSVSLASIEPPVDESLSFQTSDTGRLVHIGSDPSSDDHDIDPEASVLAGNAITWAGQSTDPAVAWVEGTQSDSDVLETLTAVLPALTNLTEILIGDLDTAPLDTSACGGSPCDVLYVGPMVSSGFTDLLAAESNVESFVNSGGGLVAEHNLSNANAYKWLPFEDQIGHTGSVNQSGEAVTILETGHPVMAGLTNAGLSNWGFSVHSQFNTAVDAGFLNLAQGTNSLGLGSVTAPYIIAREEAPAEAVFTFTITMLPTGGGTLCLEPDPAGPGCLDNPAITVGSVLPDNMVTFISDGTPGTHTFEYSATEGPTTDIAVVTVIVGGTENCLNDVTTCEFGR